MCGRHQRHAQAYLEGLAPAALVVLLGEEELARPLDVGAVGGLTGRHEALHTKPRAVGEAHAPAAVPVMRGWGTSGRSPLSYTLGFSGKEQAVAYQLPSGRCLLLIRSTAFFTAVLMVAVEK